MSMNPMSMVTSSSRCRRAAVLPCVAIAMATALLADASASAEEVVLKFQAAPLVAGAEVSPEDLEAARKVIDARVNGGKLLKTLTVSSGDDGTIIVQGDGITDARSRQITQLVTRPGSCEFAILANSRDHKDHLDGEHAEGVPPNDNTDALFCWVPVSDDFDVKSNQMVTRKDDGGKTTHVLAAFGSSKDRVTEQSISRSSIDRRNAQIAVSLQFTDAGGQLVRKLTTAHLPDDDGFARHMAVIVDGKMVMAPFLRASIGKAAMISGNFTAEDCDQMVQTFRSGRLPVKLTRVP